MPRMPRRLEPDRSIETGALTMKRRNWAGVLFALSCGAATLAGSLGAVATTQGETPFGRRDPWMPEWMMREPGAPGPMSPTMMARMLRHAEFLNFGEGHALYRANCAQCHGANGLGDGEEGRALSPSPAVLAFMITRPISVDPYLLWSVSEGGAQFGSEMPAFKSKLSREEIWKIVAFMRSGFPDAEAPQQ
jgi:hypothetical protein